MSRDAHEGLILRHLEGETSQQESAQVTRLRRLFGPDDGELAAGLLRLGPREIAQCDNDPNRPENGRLSFVLGGGR